MLRRLLNRHAHGPVAAALACLAVAGSMPAASAQPLPSLDLKRFAGRWYVIAQAPPTDARVVGAFFEYRPGGDGRLVQTYTARRAFDREPVVVEREAVLHPQQPARWSLRRGWFGSVERWVLYVSPDYRFALVGEPDLAAGWILAREPVIPEWSYAGLLARLTLVGYDASRFGRIAQTPEQQNLPGS